MGLLSVKDRDSIRSLSFKPPVEVATQARLGQHIRASMPPSQQCCVETGIRRGEQLATRSPVTVDDMIVMRAWFDRHEVDKRGEGWGVDSKGYQAWLLWGGDAGRAWVEKKLEELGIERHRAKKNGEGAVKFRDSLTEGDDERNWLEEELEEVEERGRNKWGVPQSMGPVTGSFNKELWLPTPLLSILRGERGEQDRPRERSLQYINENWEKLRLNPVYIEVDPYGVPWVSEGNHRIMVAAKRGEPFVLAEVRYFTGGQKKTSPSWKPQRLIDYDARYRASFEKNPAIPGRDYQESKMVEVRYGDEVELEERTIWKREPARLTEGHFELPEVLDATEVAEAALEMQETGRVNDNRVTVSYLGKGNFGRVYRVEMPSGVLGVKLPAETNIHGKRWEAEEIREILMHEAGMANHVADLGFSIAPRSIYVELSDGTPAIVREYGEPVEELTPKEFYELEKKLVEVEQYDVQVQDDIQLYRREDGSIYVGDVGIWQVEPRRIKPKQKHSIIDSALPGLLDVAMLRYLKAEKGASLPFALFLANRIRESIRLEKEEGVESLFLEQELKQAERWKTNREALGLPVPYELKDALRDAANFMRQMGQET
jgi:hypothetical protein